MGQLSLLSFSIPFLEIPIKCLFPTTVHLFLLPFYSLFHLFFLWQQPLLSLSCRTQARRKERTHECIPHGASPPSSTLPQVPSRLLWYTGGFKDLGKRRALYGRTLADYQLKEEKSTCLFVTTTVRHDARKTHKVAKQEKRNKRILPPLQVVQSCALSAVLGAHAVHIDLSRWRRTDRATLGLSCYTVSLSPRSGPHLPGGISINVAEPSNVPWTIRRPASPARRETDSRARLLNTPQGREKVRRHQLYLQAREKTDIRTHS